MSNVNSIRPDGRTSLRALCEVRSAAHASRRRKSFVYDGAGQRNEDRLLKGTVNDRKAAALPPGGWRQNGRKRERGKQGDLRGSTRCSWPVQGSKSRPAGVRASIIARKRVTSVELRDAGRWKDEQQNNGKQPTLVPAWAMQWLELGRAQLTWRAPKVWPTSLCVASDARISLRNH